MSSDERAAVDSTMMDQSDQSCYYVNYNYNWV